MPKDPLRKKWQNQKDNAKARGIGFELTYEEWCRWWRTHLGPDWVNLRGCRHGQYVMARHNDRGPYAFWNIKCISHAENYREYNRHNRRFGEATATHKITEKEAHEIINLKGKTTKEIAKIYGLHQSTVSQIRKGRRWSHLQPHLPPPT